MYKWSQNEYKGLYFPQSDVKRLKVRKNDQVFTWNWEKQFIKKFFKKLFDLKFFLLYYSLVVNNSSKDQVIYKKSG